MSLTQPSTKVVMSIVTISWQVLYTCELVMVVVHTSTAFGSSMLPGVGQTGGVSTPPAVVSMVILTYKTPMSTVVVVSLTGFCPSVPSGGGQVKLVFIRFVWSGIQQVMLVLVRQSQVGRGQYWGRHFGGLLELKLKRLSVSDTL